MKETHDLEESEPRRHDSGFFVLIACIAVLVVLLGAIAALLLTGSISFPGGQNAKGSQSVAARPSAQEPAGSRDSAITEDISALGIAGSEQPGAVDLQTQEVYANERFGFSLDVPDGFVLGSQIDDGDGIVLTNSALHMTVTVLGYNNDRNLDCAQLSSSLWNGSSDSLVRTDDDRVIIYQYDDEYEYFIWAYVGVGSIDQMTIRYPLQDDNRDELAAAQSLMQGFFPGDVSSPH